MHACMKKPSLNCLLFCCLIVAFFGLVYFGPFVFFPVFFFFGSIVGQQRRALNVWRKYLPIKLCLTHFQACLVVHCMVLHWITLHEFSCSIILLQINYFLKIISHQIWTQHHLSHERKRTNQQLKFEHWKIIIIYTKNQNNQTLEQKPSGWAMFVTFLH